MRRFLKADTEGFPACNSRRTPRPRHINGKDLGVLWHPPFRIEITSALKPGTMGRALAAYPDWFLKNQPRPTPARKAFVNWFYHRPDTPLRPAGLIGPVEVRLHCNGD